MDSSEFRKIMGARLKKIRGLLKLTQAQLGEKLKSNEPQISNIENGKMLIPLDIVQALIKQYNVSPRFILFGEGDVFSNFDEEFMVLLEDFARRGEDEKKLVEGITKSKILYNLMYAHYSFNLQGNYGTVIEKEMARYESETQARED